MAGAVQESKLDVPLTFHEGRAAGKQPEASPEREEVERQKPERGLTFKVTGAAPLFGAASG